MKTSFTRLLMGLALTFLFAHCEDEWSDETTMGYIISINDNNDGTCTYDFAHERGGSRFRSITTDCGKWNINDGIYIDQK